MKKIPFIISSVKLSGKTIKFSYWEKKIVNGKAHTNGKPKSKSFKLTQEDIEKIGVEKMIAFLE